VALIGFWDELLLNPNLCQQFDMPQPNSDGNFRKNEWKKIESEKKIKLPECFNGGKYFCKRNLR